MYSQFQIFSRFAMVLMVTLVYFIHTPSTYSQSTNPHAWGNESPNTLSGATETAFIKNPLATDSIQEFLEAILTVVMVLSVPVIIFFLIYAGFLYATARGNRDQIKQATQAFTYAIIGGLIVLGAMVLVGIIQNLVTAFGAEGTSSGGSGGSSGGSGGSSSSIFSDTVNVGGQPTVE